MKKYEKMRWLRTLEKEIFPRLYKALKKDREKGLSIDLTGKIWDS